MPAIDEIEDIAKGAYDEFDQVFQDKEYWSCQPSFRKNKMTVKYHGIFTTSTATGNYYDDDDDRARATKVAYDPNTGDYPPVSSSVDGNTNHLNAQNNGAYSSDFTYKIDSAGENISYHEGNNARTEKCRVRAVYKSGIGTKSGTTAN